MKMKNIAALFLTFIVCLAFVQPVFAADEAADTTSSLGNGLIGYGVRSSLISVIHDYPTGINTEIDPITKEYISPPRYLYLLNALVGAKAYDSRFEELNDGDELKSLRLIVEDALDGQNSSLNLKINTQAQHIHPLSKTTAYVPVISMLNKITYHAVKPDGSPGTIASYKTMANPANFAAYYLEASGNLNRNSDGKAINYQWSGGFIFYVPKADGSSSGITSSHIKAWTQNIVKVISDTNPRPFALYFTAPASLLKTTVSTKEYNAIINNGLALGLVRDGGYAVNIRYSLTKDGSETDSAEFPVDGEGTEANIGPGDSKELIQNPGKNNANVYPGDVNMKFKDPTTNSWWDLSEIGEKKIIKLSKNSGTKQYEIKVEARSMFNFKKDRAGLFIDTQTAWYKAVNTYKMFRDAFPNLEKWIKETKAADYAACEKLQQEYNLKYIKEVLYPKAEAGSYSAEAEAMLKTFMTTAKMEDSLYDIEVEAMVFMLYYELSGYADGLVSSVVNRGYPNGGYNTYNAPVNLKPGNLIVDRLYAIDALTDIPLKANTGVEDYNGIASVANSSGIQIVEVEAEAGQQLNILARVGYSNTLNFFIKGDSATYTPIDDIRVNFLSVVNDKDMKTLINTPETLYDALASMSSDGNKKNTAISKIKGNGFDTTSYEWVKRYDTWYNKNTTGLLPLHGEMFLGGMDTNDSLTNAEIFGGLLSFIGGGGDGDIPAANYQQFNRYVWGCDESQGSFTVPSVDSKGNPVEYVDIYVNLSGYNNNYTNYTTTNTSASEIAKMIAYNDNSDFSDDFAVLRIKVKPWMSDLILGSKTRENEYPEKLKDIADTTSPSVMGQQTTSMMTVPNGISTQPLTLTDESGNTTQSPTIDISGKQLNTIELIGVNGEPYTNNPDNRPGEGDWVTVLVPVERTFETQLGLMDSDPSPFLLGDFVLMARPYINLPETASGQSTPDIQKRLKEIIGIDYGLPTTWSVSGEYGGVGNEWVKSRIISIEYFDYDVSLTEADKASPEAILNKRLQEAVAYDAPSFRDKPFTTGTRLIIEYSYRIPTKEDLNNSGNFTSTGEAGKFHTAFKGKSIQSFVLEFYIHTKETSSMTPPVNMYSFNDYAAIRVGWEKPYRNLRIIKAEIIDEAGNVVATASTEGLTEAEARKTVFSNLTTPADYEIDLKKLYYARVTAVYEDLSGTNKPSELKQFEALVTSNFNGTIKTNNILALPKGTITQNGNSFVFDYKALSSVMPTSSNVTSLSQMETAYTMILPLHLGEEKSSATVTFNLDHENNLKDNSLHSDWEQVVFSLSGEAPEVDNAITDIRIIQVLNGTEKDITEPSTRMEGPPLTVTNVGLSPDYNAKYIIETTVTRMTDSIRPEDITNGPGQMKYEIFNGEIIVQDTPAIKESSNGNKLDKKGDTITYRSSVPIPLTSSTNLIVNSNFIPEDADLTNNHATLIGEARIDFVAENIKVYPDNIDIPNSNNTPVLGHVFDGTSCYVSTAKSSVTDPQATFTAAVSYNDPSSSSRLPDMYTNFDTIDVQVLMYSSPIGGVSGGSPQLVWRDQNVKISPGQTIQIQGNLNSSGTKDGTGKIEWKANYEYRFVLVVNGGNGNPASRSGRKFNYEADWTNNESWDTMRVQGDGISVCPKPCKTSRLSIVWGPVTFSYTECPTEEWYDCPCETYTTVTTTDSKGNTSTSTYCSKLKTKGCCRGTNCKSWVTQASFSESYESRAEIRGTYSNGNWVPLDSNYKISAGEWFELRVITSYSTNRSIMPPPNPYGGCAYLTRTPGYATPPAYRTVSIRWTNTTSDQQEGWVTSKSGWEQIHNTQRFQVPVDIGPVVMKLEWTTSPFDGYMNDAEHPQGENGQLCEAPKTYIFPPIEAANIKEGTTMID